MTTCDICGCKVEDEELELFTCDECGAQFCKHCGDEKNLKCKNCVSGEIETREDQAESEQVEFGSEEKEEK